MNVLAAAFSHDIPCVLITGGWNPPGELLMASDRYHVPLLRTSTSTAVSIAKIEYLLDDELAERQVIHGVLMDMLGLGVLIIGERGIGKSECGRPRRARAPPRRRRHRGNPPAGRDDAHR